MHILGARRNPIELEMVEESVTPKVVPAARAIVAAATGGDAPILRASRAFFGIGIPARPTMAALGAAPSEQRVARTATFGESESGLLRTVYKEIVLRFKVGVTEAARRRALAHHGFEVRQVNVTPAPRSSARRTT